jgi:preflagellin peptidase FlaK
MLIIQVLVSFSFLIIASILDIKDREIPNILWKIFIPISVVIVISNLYLNPNNLLLTLISIVTTTTISLIIFYLGLYGGADVKALITLSISHPISLNTLYIFPLLPIISLNTLYIFPLLPISALNNSLFIMTLFFPTAIIRNLYWKIKNRKSLFEGLENEPFLKKVGALLFCIKKSKSEIKPYHIIAERSEESKRKKTLHIFQKIPESNTNVDDISDDIFILFSLPMLPFLTLGYLITIMTGDLIFNMISMIF